MERSKLIKLIVILAAVLLIAVVAAIILFGSQNMPSVTEPSGSNPLSGEIIPGTVGTGDPTDPMPSGDVGVGIWGEDDPTDGVTDPTDGASEPTNGASDPTDPSGDVDVGIWDDPTTQPTTEPTTQPTQPAVPTDPPAPGQLTWEQYLALSSEQRYEYYKTFESMDAFFDWKNAAEEAYNATHTIPTIDGNIDLGDLIGGNG